MHCSFLQRLIRKNEECYDNFKSELNEVRDTLYFNSQGLDEKERATLQGQVRYLTFRLSEISSDGYKLRQDLKRLACC